MKNCFLSFLLLILICNNTKGQKNYSTSGRVIDITDNSGLSGVNIIYGTNQGATTNKDGYFKITSDSIITNLSFQYMGL